ncbi:MAG: hypothetical protein ACLSA0_09190 [Eisenbergiella massiliensis]
MWMVHFWEAKLQGGFAGAYIGMFASGNGKEYDEYVQFSYFMYKEKE